MAERHYVGEIGTVIIVDCGVDITSSSNTKLKVKKPDGTLVEWTAAIYLLQYLKYTTISGDFNLAGEYFLHSYVETSSGWKGVGETVMFKIYAQYGT